MVQHQLFYIWALILFSPIICDSNKTSISPFAKRSTLLTYCLCGCTGNMNNQGILKKKKKLLAVIVQNENERVTTTPICAHCFLDHLQSLACIAHDVN